MVKQILFNQKIIVSIPQFHQFNFDLQLFFTDLLYAFHLLPDHNFHMIH